MEMDIDSLVGFRFQPTNEEIIRLLKMKRLDPDFSVHTIKEIDFYGLDPWDLPKHSGIQSKESIWYFYCKRYYKYSKSKRAHRRTISGYWKITGNGSDMKAKNSKDVIGHKKILSFHSNDPASKQAKPEWVMHEIHVKEDDHYKEDYVVCRLERRRDNKPTISTNDEGESSQRSATENTSPNSVLPPNQPFVSNRSHVAENNIVLPNQCDGYNALNKDSCELQFPIYGEQGSSYTNSPSTSCDLLNSHCDSEQVDDLINSPRAFQNNYLCEETGQTLTHEFNTSMSDGGVYAEDCQETGQILTPEFNPSPSNLDGLYAEDVSEADSESFNAWVNTVFKY